MKIDVSKYANRFSLANKCARVLWGAVWLLVFRPTPSFLFGWRRFLLRCFGANLAGSASVYPSARIWAPWNLTMGEHSCLSHFVDCYCVDKITIGAHATVSQYAFLCAATHDISDPHMQLVTRPIAIGDGAWVCAGAFVGPGVTIGEGAVAGARAVVTKDVAAWQVVAGNPAVFKKKRVLKTSRHAESDATA